MSPSVQDPHAYLKWPRLIAFALTGALAVVCTGLSAQSIVNLRHDEADVRRQVPGGSLQATDALGASATLAAVAGLAGLYTFLLSNIILFKLQKVETKKTILMKELAFGIITIMFLASAIAAAIIIGNRSATIVSTLLSAEQIQSIVLPILASQGRSLAYKDSLAFEAMIIAWIAFLTTLISFVLTSLAARHIAKYGSEPTITGSGGHKEHGEKVHSEHA